MTKSNLFIPTKIKVGFQERQGTFTGKLAYVIYYDTKGKLRKEQSWEGWRSKNIDPIDFENKPTKGFILNKDVQRYGWEYYSSGRSMIRIYDPRDFEFEITPANLLFILMNTNCFKRELEGEFVYAYDGKDLVLLPTCCEEYKTSVAHTTLQGSKVSARDLKVGATYKDKKNEDFIYLGRMRWLKNKEKYSSIHYYVYENQHVFVKANSTVEEPEFEAKDASKLAKLVNEDPIDNIAEYLVKAQESQYHQLPVFLSLKPKPSTKTSDSNENPSPYLYKQINLTEVEQFRRDWSYRSFYSGSCEKDYYYYAYRKVKIEKEGNTVTFSSTCRSNSYALSPLEVSQLIETELFVILENNTEVSYDKF